MIRIAVAGAAGRMGRALIDAVAETRDLSLCAAIESRDSPALGSDAGTVAGVKPLGVVVGSDIDAADFDVLIEFTRPAQTLEHVAYCADAW
jgi:4-hydroxy-tetrahydrodipicolinate reductase